MSPSWGRMRGTRFPRHVANTQCVITEKTRNPVTVLWHTCVDTGIICWATTRSVTGDTNQFPSTVGEHHQGTSTIALTCIWREKERASCICLVNRENLPPHTFATTVNTSTELWISIVNHGSAGCCYGRNCSQCNLSECTRRRSTKGC